MLLRKDGSMSAAALGVCHDSLAHRGWPPGRHSVVMLGWQSCLGANPASPLSPDRRPGGFSQWQRLSTALARHRLRLAGASCWLPCGQQRSRAAHPAHSAMRHGPGNRHHCLSVIGRLWCQSVGTVLLHHAKAFGLGSLPPRAGGAVASSVVMHPGKSLRLVARAHHHCHQFDGLLWQPASARGAAAPRAGVGRGIGQCSRNRAARALWRWVWVTARWRLVAGCPWCAHMLSTSRYGTRFA